jgi:uncharacterized protein (DUF2062 family)
MRFKITQIKFKLFASVKSMLKEGMQPRQIALCIALGISLGIFPVLGMTTLLCAIAAFTLRLNLPAIQIVNYLVYPVQLILLVPFYGTGSWLFRQPESHRIGDSLIHLIRHDFWGSMANLWDLTLYAILTWLVISPFIILVLYLVLKPAIHSLAHSYLKLQSSK